MLEVSKCVSWFILLELGYSGAFYFVLKYVVRSRVPILRPLSYFVRFTFSHFCIFFSCHIRVSTRLCAPKSFSSYLSQFVVISDCSMCLIHDHELSFCAMLHYPWQLQTAPSVMSQYPSVSVHVCFARLAIKVWAKRPGNRVCISCSDNRFGSAALSLAEERQGRAADHTSSYSVEVKNKWSYTSERLHALVL